MREVHLGTFLVTWSSHSSSSEGNKLHILERNAINCRISLLMYILPLDEFNQTPKSCSLWSQQGHGQHPTRQCILNILKPILLQLQHSTRQRVHPEHTKTHPPTAPNKTSSFTRRSSFIIFIKYIGKVLYICCIGNSRLWWTQLIDFNAEEGITDNLPNL